MHTHFPGLPLHTSRLLLRPYRDDDAAAIFAVHSDPEVMRYWSTAPWREMAQAQQSIRQSQAGMESGEALRLALVRQADSALIGQCTLFQFVRHSKRAEMGYSMARSAWGQGYMHEALCALVRYAFDVLDLNRLEADIDPRNRASARTLERLGFVREGFMEERWIIEGRPADSDMYGLIRRRWQASPLGAAQAAPSPRLRIAEDHEREALADLRVRAMRPSLEAVGRFEPQRARDRLLTGFRSEDTRVIEVDGQCVGVLVFRLPPHDSIASDKAGPAPDCRLEHLYIDPPQQGRGWGAWALRQVLALAQAQGRAVQVGALRESPANRFYLRHGFEKIGESEWDIEYRWKAAP